jgi:hypothetical protein
MNPTKEQNEALKESIQLTNDLMELFIIRDKRIDTLEQGIKDHISQLIDGGMLEDSLMIITLKTLLKK